MRTPDLYQYRLAGSDGWSTCGPKMFDAFVGDDHYETRKLYALPDVGAAVWTPDSVLVRSVSVTEWKQSRFPNLILAEILEGMARLLRNLS